MYLVFVAIICAQKKHSSKFDKILLRDYNLPIMIKKVVKKRTLAESNQVKEDLEYWLSKSAEERIQAVDYLRKQSHGHSERLQRVARVIQRAQG